MRQMQGGGSKVMSFGKSRAKRMAPDSPKIGFKDVAGVDEAVEELQEIKEFLENPKKFQALGARIPKGVLLYGPPGTGKTLLARAVAGEAGVPFFSISGSDFVEMFVGVGASRVRDLFEQAKQASPCIVFVDEIDAVGRHRGAGIGGGNDEREQTLNQLLVEMDGFEMKDNIILIAATNRPDILDPALLRPGRFDRQIVVDRPDRNGRRKILEVHSKGKPLAPAIDSRCAGGRHARGSPAPISRTRQRVALLAEATARRWLSRTIRGRIMRVIAGPEKKARLLSEKEQRITAYHEMGHASLVPIRKPNYSASLSGVVLLGCLFDPSIGSSGSDLQKVADAPALLQRHLSLLVQLHRLVDVVSLKLKQRHELSLAVLWVSRLVSGGRHKCLLFFEKIMHVHVVVPIIELLLASGVCTVALDLKYPTSHLSSPSRIMVEEGTYGAFHNCGFGHLHVV